MSEKGSGLFSGTKAKGSGVFFGPTVAKMVDRRPKKTPGAVLVAARPILVAPLVIAFVITFAGCSTDNVEKQPTPAPHAARTEIERGPIRVAVEFSPSPARLSDEPTLTLTLDYETGIVVQKPPFGEAMGDFAILDFREPLPESNGDRQITRQVYTLEPQRTGTLQIDPILIRFTDSRAEGDGQEHTVETESLAVEITSIADGEAPSLDDVHRLAGPMPIEKPRFSFWWLLGGVFLLVITGAATMWLLLRRRAAPVTKPLSPQELAYLELERLTESGLSDHDVKQFYVELTGIVRRYIERTTSVHAPEQTTEEFLREISTGATFSKDERARLASFLESADLVKFAAHEPTAADIESTFERAKAFLGLEVREAAA